MCMSWPHAWHHRPHDAFGVEHGNFAGVGEAGCFQDWKGVHVGAQEDGLPWAILQHADDSMAANVGGDVESLESLQLDCNHFCSVSLKIRELGVLMEVLVQRHVFLHVYGCGEKQVGHRAYDSTI